VGQAVSVEDAVFVDLDGDGAVDVVSSCEGTTRSIFVHWAPREKSRYLDPDAWQTAPVPVAQGKTMWMFCVPAQVDGRHGVDLIVGSKGKMPGEAVIGWLQAPASARDLGAWTWHLVRPAGWIMGIETSDMDGDGDADIVFSDRFNAEKSGCYWLENPGPAAAATRPWKEHPILCCCSCSLNLLIDIGCAGGRLAVCSMFTNSVDSSCLIILSVSSIPPSTASPLSDGLTARSIVLRRERLS
jgi:hypothetical protein